MASKTAIGLMVAILLALTPRLATAADFGVGYRHGGAVGTYHFLGFWGRPYPFGYQWSLVKACDRLEPVETAHGTTMRHVWVCDVRKGYANR